ncbi:MAG: multicopper oxidase domain-containing protein [Vicinamibacteraceae bacterium]|nr:multicopper oxidase domain-containing protein [Vicinamibacteraceae bacterium]MCL4814185.1 multicopper oxidase domain-containing protein [Vicinamibacteraceae bacterium]
MTARRVLIAIVAGFGLAAALAAARQDSPVLVHPGEYVVEGRVFGMPRAEVFTEDYDGPPVVGDAVTKLPELSPLAPGNHTHDVRMDIVAQRIEIAPGVRYDAWTFGGSVPGPVLHVREGDRVRFTMKNRSAERVAVTPPSTGASPFLQAFATADLQRPEAVAVPMHHSIDFHAATVAGDDKWQMIQPGESIRFEWVANYPGVFIYHCGVPPVLQHVAMGQYGVVVVSPRNGYPTDGLVDREYVVVQSEFYLTEGEDGLYALDFERAARKDPSHVIFNGHLLALTTHPLTADAGERVRLYLHNVGPNDQASHHVIGTVLDRVYYEGNPGNDWRGLQTVVLGASNGAVVEFIAPEEGDYILLDHELADAQKGAIAHIRVRSRTGEDTGIVTSMGH